MMRVVYGTLALIVALLLGIGGYFAYREFATPTYQIKPSNIISPSPTSDAIPAVTSQERTRGWYWGAIDQKKPGTPLDWVYQEAGRSSCWHKPDVSCGAAH